MRAPRPFPRMTMREFFLMLSFSGPAAVAVMILRKKARRNFMWERYGVGCGNQS